MRALAAMALMLTCLTARAEDSDSDVRARQLYENGAILYDEGRYEDAIVAWQEAWNLSQRPLLLYNIANAQERLGMWRDALDTLNRYRAFAKPEERERLDRRINNLERRLAEEEAAAPVVEPTTQPVTQPTTEPTQPTDIIPVVEVDPVRRTSWIPITAYSIGGAGIVAGTVFGLQARNARETAAGLCQGDAVTICPDSATDALRLDGSRSLLADGAFIVGGLGLAGGTVAMALLNTSGIGTGPLTLTPSGVLLRGQF